MKHYILLIMAFTFLCITASAQKQIHFFHGLGGSIENWAALEQIINNNCPNVETTNKTYLSTEGVDAYISDFQNMFGDISSPNDIAIAHSFGGLVLRQMDANNTQDFGGYITVASPHHGAQLANSAIDGSVQNYLENGCRQVIEQPLEAANNTLQSSLWTSFFSIFTDILADASEIFCDAAWDALLEDWLVANYGGSNFQSVQEMLIGGMGASLPQSSLPSVSITGESPEEWEVHWELLKQQSDLNVPQIAKDIENTYRNIANDLRAISGVFRVRWYSPITWTFGGLRPGLLNTANELDGGANWIAASESGWAELIGAGGGGTWVSEFVEVPIPENSQCIYDEDCHLGGPGPQLQRRCVGGQCVDMNGDPCEVPNGGTTTVEVQTFIPNPIFPNDGVLTLATQDLPGDLRTEAVNGVTHFSEQSDVSVRVVINDQFQTESSANSIFTIQDCSI